MTTDDLYFYNQSEFRKIPRRYRKLPEDLPESLRFAHLNPKVAALLASKERIHKQEKDDPFGDGLGQKSLIPDINSAFQNVRNQFDSALSNDEDSQRYLFEEAKYSAQGILEQLSRIIYFYDELHKHIPKSLEYQLMSSYVELTADVTVVPREWQTHEMKEQYAASLQREAVSDLDDFDDELSRPRSRVGSMDKTPSEFGSRMNLKKRGGPRLGVIEASPDEDLESRVGGRKTVSRQSMMSHQKLHIDVSHSRMGSRVRKGSILSGISPSVYKGRIRDDQFSMIDETPSDLRLPKASKTKVQKPSPKPKKDHMFKWNYGKFATAMAMPASYMQTINFQLSNPSFEDKGWIMMKGRQEEVDPNAILEHCVTKLQETMKHTAAIRQKEIEQGYDKAVVVRYYGDTRKETILKFRRSPVKSTPSNVHKGGKPNIPSINDERNEGKKLMQAAHIDGSTMIYYPSGRPAIIHSAAGYGRPGYYTLVYEDGLDSRMLACFTPSGKGVCYHPNGVVRFLSTEKGGHLSEEDGVLIRKWKWPQANVKITEPITLQITPHLLFRCVGRGQMTIVFSCHKETARFSVSPSPGAEDFKPGEDTEQLLTAFTFSSKTAKDLMRIFAPMKKHKKPKGRKQTAKSQTTEIVKLLNEFPDKVTYDIEADKELAKLQRKAKNLVDDWMEHYRLALGLSSPVIESMSDRPQYSIATRQAKSAKQSEQGLMIRKAVLGIDDDDHVKRARVPSAPLGLSGEKYEEDEDLLDVPIDSSTKRDSMVTFEEPGHAGGDNGIVPSAVALINRMADTASRRSARSKASSARSISPSRQSVFTSMSERIPSALSGNRSHCPLVIRQQILGYERPQCRCSRHHIPFIMDIEIDEYINTEVPEGQLIVIMIVSSLFPGITKAEEMLNEIYQNQNRNRTRPCVQSRSDMFRVFKYDINTAAEMSDHTQPLLLTRHNVVPGMFLMYCDGKLLFCDHIFNGYGSARKDFKKQVMKSRHDAIHQYYLPRDFKFSPSRGRSGLRSAWGGEIGGAGVDKYSSPGTVLDSSLVPIHRPVSSSSGNSKEIQLDAVRLEEAAKLLATTLSSTGYQRMSLHPSVPQHHVPETKA